jgi:hypothetical protein
MVRVCCRYIACVVLGIFVLLAALIYIAHIGRFAGLVANRIIGALIVVLSALCIVAIGLTPFFASTILKTRNAEYDLRDLHAKSMRFFAAEQAGQPTSVLTPEWRKAPTDGNVRNTKINQPLNGGWYTGPGLSKVTWPQAIAVTELSFALITHYDILSTMPSAVPGPLKVPILRLVWSFLGLHAWPSRCVGIPAAGRAVPLGCRGAVCSHKSTLIGAASVLCWRAHPRFSLIVWLISFLCSLEHTTVVSLCAVVYLRL